MKRNRKTKPLTRTAWTAFFQSVGPFAWAKPTKREAELFLDKYDRGSLLPGTKIVKVRIIRDSDYRRLLQPQAQP